MESGSLLKSLGVPFEVEDLPGQRSEPDPLGRTAAHYGVATIPDFTLYAHQTKVVDLIVEGQNVLLTSGTASGKTEAACLAVLAKGGLRPRVPCQVLFLYPTKALSNDQSERLARYFYPYSVCRFDGDNDKRRSEVSHSEIVLTNPQMLTEHLKFASPFSSFLNNLAFLVIDEVHLYTSYQWSLLLSYFHMLKKKGLGTQVVLLSATLGNAAHLCQIAGDRLGRPFAHVDGAAVAAPTRRYRVTQPVEDLEEILGQLIKGYSEEQAGTLVFLPYRTQVNALCTSIDGGRVVRHHGALNPGERRAVELGLKRGTASVCLTCKTLQQGIDIGRVGRVVHVGLPDTVAEFWQREGRKGRVPGSHAESVVIPFSPWDAAIIGDAQRYGRYLAMPIEVTPLPRQSAASTLFDAFYAAIYGLPLETATLQLAKELGWIDSWVDFQAYMMEEDEPLRVAPTELGQSLFSNLSFYGFGRVPLVHHGQQVDETSYTEAVRSALPGCILRVEGEPYVVTGWSKYPASPDPDLVIYLKTIGESDYAPVAEKVKRGTIFSRVHFMPSDITVENLRGPFSIVRLRPSRVDIFESTNLKPRKVQERNLRIAPQLPIYTNAFLLDSQEATEADAELAVHILLHAMREAFSIPLNTYVHVVTSNGQGSRALLYETLWGDTHLLLDKDRLINSALRLADSPSEELLLPRCGHLSPGIVSNRAAVMDVVEQFATGIGSNSLQR